MTPSQPASVSSSSPSCSSVSGGASGSRCAAWTSSGPPAVGLEVDAGDDPVAEQERQHVVAVRALGGRRVDLDPVAEAEQPFGARRGTRPAGRTGASRARASIAPRDARLVPEIGRSPPALDGDRQQLLLLDQLGDPELRIRGGEAEIVAQVGRRGDAESPAPRCAELALGLVGGRRRRLDHRPRQHALDDVIEALEAERCGPPTRSARSRTATRARASSRSSSTRAPSCGRCRRRRSPSW